MSRVHCRSHRTTRLSILILGLAVAACETATESHTVSLSLEGIVKDGTGVPIAGATVSLMDGGSSCVPTAYGVGPTRRRGAGEGWTIHTAAVLPFPRPATTAAHPPARTGPVCTTLATATTDAQGRYDMTYIYTHSGRCGSGLGLGAIAPGYQSARPATLTTPACIRPVQVFDFQLSPNTSTVLPPSGNEPDEPSQPDRPSEPAEPLPAPVPFAPANGVAVAQNVDPPGCAPHPTRGSGFVIQFDWSDAIPASRPWALYHIVVRHVGSQFPIIDRTVVQSDLTYSSCGFVIDRNLDDWRWRVASYAPGEPEVWSEYASFSFEPCRLVSGQACYALPEEDATDSD